MSLQPCNESRKALFGFPAPLGVNEGQLTSTSGTSAAHLRDGYRGYRPEAPSACIIGGMCIQKKRGVGGDTAWREQLSYEPVSAHLGRLAGVSPRCTRNSSITARHTLFTLWCC